MSALRTFSVGLSLSLSLLLSACTAEVGEEPTASTEVSQASLTNSPDLLCAPASYGGHDYWLCPTLRTWSSARAQCQAIGYDLATIETSGENQFLLSKLLVNAWIGANDQTTEGTWRWAQTNSQFWQGTASGSAVGGAYRNWGLFEPNNLFNQDCAMFRGGLGLGTWSDENCGLLANFICEGDLCPNDPNKSEPGQCGCGVADADSDGDGTADCVDGCANDPAKSAPGACGCGLSDADSDNDGVTCDDLCPNDQTKTAPGDCGCADSPQPSGTACGDGLCVENTQCNGAGSCGTASECGAPDSDCEYRMRAGTSYWFCDNDRTFADAEARCQSKGMELVTIESAGEDAFITQHANEHSFLGGSDQTTEGTWEWLGTGAQFWSGGPSGNAVGGAYTNFAWGEPSNLLSGHDCLVKSLVSGGKWKSHPCEFQDAFVCEVRRECLSDDDCPDKGLCDIDSQCVPPVVLAVAPIQLAPRWEYDPATGTEGPTEAVATSATPTTFQIPPRLHVTIGNAANGYAEFSYGTGAYSVTCTYRGGSSTSTPNTDLELARGRNYHFVSCTDGHVPGDSLSANQWRARVLNGDTRQSRTEISLELGPGCQSVLEPPISPEETVQMRQEFKWRATTALPEIDPQGHSALHYALIYVESDEQLEALKRSPLIASPKPLFGSELAKYEGQCGSPDYEGDGTGLFVHTFLPAKIYNHWRQMTLDALNAGHGEIPFRAVILRPIPEAEFANSDGSVSWQALKDAGASPFRPAGSTQQPLFGIHIPIVDDVIEVVQDSAAGAAEFIAGVASPFVHLAGSGITAATGIVVMFHPESILETFAAFAEDIRDEVLQFVGDIDEFIFGSVNLDFTLTVLNMSPGFDTTDTMRRAWGPGRGTPLVPSGSELRLFQFPGFHFGDVSPAGTVRIKAVKGRRMESLCWGLENSRVMVSHFLTEDEFCVFTGGTLGGLFGPGSIGAAPTRDKRSGIGFSHPKINVFTQMTDASQYMSAVAGFTPDQVEVAVGGAMAATIGALNGDRSVAMCLDYPEMKVAATAIIAAGAAAVGAIVAGPAGIGPGAIAGTVGGIGASPFLNKDVFIVDLDAKRSRLVPTHEYGHFVMCHHGHREGPGTLPDWYTGRAFEGAQDSREDEIGIAMEAFADIVSQQVAGGTNYVKGIDEARVTDSSGYCFRAQSMLSCTEANFRGVGDGSDDVFKDEVSRLMTTLYDALDRPNDSWRTSAVPTNNDAWSAVATTLVPAASGYLPSVDESVALSGANYRTWMVNMARRGPRVSDATAALAETMSDAGVTWCDACRLFALHDNMFDASAADERTVWTACVGTSEFDPLPALVGPPPDPALRLDAASCEVCLPRQISDANGNCVTCTGAREIASGNSCFECPAGTRATNSNACVPCVDGTISTDANQCVDCPPGTAPDGVGDTCVDCAADITVDFSTPPQLCRQESFQNFTTVVAPGDQCSGDSFVAVDGLDVLGDALANADPLAIYTLTAQHFPIGGGTFTPAQCATFVGTLPVEQITEFSDATSSSTAFNVLGQGDCLPGATTCATPCLIAFEIDRLDVDDLAPALGTGRRIVSRFTRIDPATNLTPMAVTVSSGLHSNCP